MLELLELEVVWEVELELLELDEVEWVVAEVELVELEEELELDELVDTEVVVVASGWM